MRECPESRHSLLLPHRLPPDRRTASSSAIAYAGDIRIARQITNGLSAQPVQTFEITCRRRIPTSTRGTRRSRQPTWLDPEMTKTKEGREAYLTPELRSMLVAQVERVEALQRQADHSVAVPARGQGRRAGAQTRNVRKVWTTGCQVAGVAGRLRHDLRRTAVRNMVNAGVAEGSGGVDSGPVSLVDFQSQAGSSTGRARPLQSSQRIQAPR